MRLIKKRYLSFGFVVILSFIIIWVFYIKIQYVIPILMYHKIDNNSAFSKLSVAPDSFKRQMAFLKRHNYNIIRLSELPALLKKGKIPNKTIVITFDDGYKDNYISAFPILKKYKIPVTIFISPALIGEEGYLTWDEVMEMYTSGLISIGSHTMAHTYLPGLPEERLKKELSDSKVFIENKIGKHIIEFCYPLGGFNDFVRDKVIKAGYKIAVATNPGKDYPKDDLFAMKRLCISKTSDNLFVFWIESSGFYTWIKEHRDKDW